MRNRYEIQNRFVDDREAATTRARIARRHSSYNIADEVYDLEWAKQHTESRVANNYYDYFFAGPDIKVRVGEIADNDVEFGDMPMHDLAFNVEQQKAPLYGYWSYTYDTVMRGTRLISGQFTLITKYPDYMKRMLAKAASNRAARHNNLRDDYPAPGHWREDDENIDKYWGKHIDPSAIAQHGTEWSIHPPFSLVLLYGVQDTSVEVKGLNASYERYERDNVLMKDQNQRLVEGYNGNATRIILDGCELTGVERGFSDAALVAERYSFFARDIIIPTSSTGTSGTTNSTPVNVPGVGGGRPSVVR